LINSLISARKLPNSWTFLGLPDKQCQLAEHFDIARPAEHKNMLQNSQDIQDCLGAQNSMFHICQHQQTAVITIDRRYIAGPHLQSASHRNTH